MSILAIQTKHLHHIVPFRSGIALGVVVHHRRLQPTAEHPEVYHTVEFLQRVAYFGKFLCRVFSVEKGLFACGLVLARM